MFMAFRAVIACPLTAHCLICGRLDGGSGRCESLLRPPGVSEKDARKLKSMTCSSKYEIY